VSSGSGDAALDQYVAAEQRELARLEELKSVENDFAVLNRDLDREYVLRTYPAIARAYVDFPDFKTLVDCNELAALSGRMRIYCPDRSTRTVRYEKEVSGSCFFC
jgi:hypothetical protein